METNDSLYWSQKSNLLTNKLKDCPYSVIVRKIILCKILDIPIEEVPFCLSTHHALKEFSLNDVDEIDERMLSNIDVQEWVSKCESTFYKDDYTTLYTIYCKYHRIKLLKKVVDPDKSDITALIEKIVIPKTYKKLSDTSKKYVDLCERIYFLPVDLFNPYIKLKYENNYLEYQNNLLSQWEAANEMASNISQQRSNMNNFYMSLISILVAGVLFSDYFTGSSDKWIKISIYIIVSMMGALLCHVWRAQINNYAKLNAVKYDIINRIERKLPANVLYYEYLVSEKSARKYNRKKNFTSQERIITIVFEVAVIIIPLLLLTGTLRGMGVWTKIKNVLR